MFAVEAVVALPFERMNLFFELLDLVLQEGDSSLSVQMSLFLIFTFLVSLLNHFSLLLKGALFFLERIGSVVSEVVAALVLLVARNSFAQIDGVFVVIDGKQVKGEGVRLGLFFIIFVSGIGGLDGLVILFVHCLSNI